MGQGFTWLHLSDLHAGMSGQSWLWPTVKDAVHDDLARVHDLAGPWDAVIFSGDLTQRGSSAEFDAVTRVLEGLWQRFEKLGFTPKFFCVPGNHDLVRPAEGDPALLLLRRWWEEERVREDTWREDSAYRKTIADAFRNYVDWCARLNDTGVPLIGECAGAMPGDRSATLELDSGKFGLVGLNSSWLQLSDGIQKGMLAADVRQLHAVTDGDPGRWTAERKSSLIVTHHPTDWFHPVAQSQWKSEIYSTGRFEAHLFGHLHDPDATAVAHGGSATRRSLQAASIFGLEKVSRLDVQRIHGYALCRLDSNGDLNVWPRLAKKQKSGDWKLVPDHEFDLDQANSFRLPGSAGSSETLEAVRPAYAEPDTKLQFADRQPETLDKLRYFLAPAPASIRVRRMEQRICLHGLTEKRAAWVASAWGSGSDGFIRAVQEHLGLPTAATFRLDLSDLSAKTMLPELVKTKLGVSFAEVCDALSSAGPGLLILDDAPTSSEPCEGRVPVELDVNEVASLLTNYCSDLHIIIRSRAKPQVGSSECAILQPLDEADLRLYIADHERGGSAYLTSEAISAIYRHTDGVPARVDTTLRELEFITVDQLASTNRDLVHTEGASDETPGALVKAVAELECSEEPHRQRSLDMLKALSAFPQGESLDRLKRFYGAKPLFPVHARELLSSSLIGAEASPGSRLTTEHAPRLLIVPRPVREYVRSRTSREELVELTKKAANLYFGEKWKGGEMRDSLAERFRNPVASAAEIGNATSIVLVLLHDAINRNDKRALGNAVQLARAYISMLHEGDHFRAVAALAREIVAQIPTEEAESRRFFSIKLGQSLRMLGEPREALQTLTALDLTGLPLSLRQAAMLSIALTHQSLDEDAEAAQVARELIKLDRHSNVALHARSIIVALGEQTDDTPEELRRIEAQARKRESHVLANNLALSRIGRPGISAEEKNTALEEVIASRRKSNDFYNLTRAVLFRAESYHRDGRLLNERDRGALIDAYHFLLSERLPSLFNRCHAALWTEFERRGEVANLFRLFRHSSLIWRLRDDESSETKFHRRLSAHATALITREFWRQSREMAYFAIRQAVLLAGGKAQTPDSTELT